MNRYIVIHQFKDHRGKMHSKSFLHILDACDWAHFLSDRSVLRSDMTSYDVVAVTDYDTSHEEPSILYSVKNGCESKSSL